MGNNLFVVDLSWLACQRLVILAGVREVARGKYGLQMVKN